MTSRRALLGVAVLVIVHLAAAWFLTVPGWLSIDEGVYHLMAEGLRHGSLAVENGYGDMPSAELGMQTVGMDQQIGPHAGRLVAQYPQMSTVLTAPLYLLEGYPALFHLNALAFLAAVAVCFWLARLLYEDRGVAAVAALAFAAASPAWSFSVGAWPHMLHLVLVLGAMAALFKALTVEGQGALGAALLSGLLLGVDLGVRLDAAFVIGAAGLILLYQPRVRWREGLALGLGLIPGLLFLSLTNHAKFGTWQPLSYGPHAHSNVQGYLPALAPGLAIVAARLVVFRSDVRRAAAGHRGLVLAGAAMVVAAAVAIPALRGLLLPWARAAWGMAVDLRVEAIGRDRVGILTGQGGGLFYYIGGFKQALLQAMPWLVLVLVPLVGWLRGRREDRWAPALLVVPLALIAIYSQKGRHGGLCLSLRYLLPALPLLALLVAPALRTLLVELRGRRVWLAALGVAAVAAAQAPLLRPLALGRHEALVLGTPLLLAVLLGALLVLERLPSLMGSPRLRLAAALVAVATLAWGAGMTFGYDVRLERAGRLRSLSAGEAIGAALPERALLVTDWGDPFYGLVAARRIRLAVPALDEGRDLPALVEHHLRTGWPVYVAYGAGGWEKLMGLPFMAGYRVVPVLHADIFLLGRLEPTP